MNCIVGLGVKISPSFSVRYFVSAMSNKYGIHLSYEIGKNHQVYLPSPQKGSVLLMEQEQEDQVNPSRTQASVK